MITLWKLKYNKILVFKMFKFLFIVLFLSSCKIGYIEVRNHSSKELKDVNWGGIIDLGNIKQQNEHGKETKIFDNQYIYFQINGIEYRSLKKYPIDAYTSETFVYSDTTSIFQTSLQTNNKNDYQENQVDAVTGTSTIF